MSTNHKILPKEEEFVSKKRISASTIVVLMAILAYIFIFSKQLSTLLLGYTLIICTILTIIMLIYEFLKFKSITQSIQSSESHEYVETKNEDFAKPRALLILVMGVAFLILTILPFYMVVLMDPATVFMLIISVGLGLNLGELIFFCYMKWWEKQHSFSLIKRKFQKNGVQNEINVWGYRVVERKKTNRKE